MLHCLWQWQQYKRLYNSRREGAFRMNSRSRLLRHKITQKEQQWSRGLWKQRENSQQYHLLKKLSELYGWNKGIFYKFTPYIRIEFPNKRLHVDLVLPKLCSYLMWWGGFFWTYEFQITYFAELTLSYSGDIHISDLGGFSKKLITRMISPGWYHPDDITHLISPTWHHLEDIIWRASPAGHHQQGITSRASPGGHHLEGITWRASPGGHHLEGIT